MNFYELMNDLERLKELHKEESCLHDAGRLFKGETTLKELEQVYNQLEIKLIIGYKNKMEKTEKLLKTCLQHTTNNI